jgi:hypothetical protein
VASGAARRLCVVSRNPLQSGAFIAGLTTSVRSHDELEIIVDRRRGSSPSDPPAIERRRPGIGRVLERDGFAIVPMAPAAAGVGANSPLRPPTGEVEPEEPYEQKLERVLRFNHRRLVQLSRWFIFSVLVNAVLFLLVITPVIRSAFRPAPPAPPASALDSPAPHVTGSPSPAATR